MLRQRDVTLRVTTVLAFLVVDATIASADCRGEVEAAFKSLDMPDRPYRSEMTIGQTYRETTDFIPPDRMRTIIDSPKWIVRILHYFMGQDPIETIRIGNRTWERWNKKWVESGFAPKTPRKMFPPKTLPFACLEAVSFERNSYAGYQTSFRPTAVAVAVPNGMSMSKREEEEALKTLREEPTRWRTILVDRETGLPAYDITTLTDQLDSPTLKIHYTYPRDLTIEPPVQ